MSAAQFDLGLRLAAHERQELVRRTAVKRFVLRPDAMLLAAVASPGDHGGLWGIAFGQAHTGRPGAVAVPDPRKFAAQVALWTDAAHAWKAWLDQCEAEGRPAQFVVADQAAAERITWSATRVSRSSFEEAEDARRAARAFLLAASAARSAGQQSLASLVPLMREHYVTGADPVDESHLGLWAHWPRLIGDTWSEPQVSIPPGADHERADLGKAWDRMVRSKGEMAQVHGQFVEAQIRKLAERRWKTLRDVSTRYRNDPAPVMDEAVRRHREDGTRFVKFMTSGRLPSGRSVLARWTSLALRERDAGKWQSALWAQDHLERLRAAAAGDVLDGVAEAGRIATVQPALRVRPGDRMVTAAGDTFSVRQLLVQAGQVLVVTDTDALAGPVTAWPEPATTMAPVPKTVPWTHDPEAPMARFEAPAQDLRALVASLTA